MAAQLDIGYIDQSPCWPTGCESVSTVMALNYLGLDIGVEEFIERYLPRAELVKRPSGWQGPDPRVAFVGDPHRDVGSYGCYAPVILQAVRHALTDAGSRFEGVDMTGLSLDGLCRQIDECRPVILWATIDFKDPYPGDSWQTPDGKVFTWTNNEHCLVLSGYDGQRYWCHDPWQGHGLVGCRRALLERCHAGMFSMAVGFRPAREAR